MSVTMPRMMLLAFLLSCFSWPSSSWALGLGEIHLNSALNEPMNAEIDLLAAAPDELTALRATLASREAFARYGIDKPPFLSTLTFKVGKGKDGRDALLVRSTDAIPEPFVTFLVEVNWARGRLMREYTVLLDPPVYTPGEAASSSAPVTAASSGAAAGAAAANSPTSAGAAQNPAPVRRSQSTDLSASPSSRTSRASAPMNSSADATSVTVGRGDTLTKIARSLNSDATPAGVDQTMIALYRSNPDAFGGNINILRQGAVLRVPNADQIAALNQKEAMGEVHRQMDAWRGGESAAPSGHLRLVTPSSGGSATGAGSSGSANADANANTQALKDRVKDLESQLAESKRLIDIRNNELSALQRKLGAPATPTPPVPSAAATAPAAKPATPPPSPAAPPAAATPPPVASSVPPPSVAPPEAVPAPLPQPVPSAAAKKPAPAPADTESWMDWVAANWWVLLVLLAAALVGLGFAAMKRRRSDEFDIGRGMEETDVADPLGRPSAPNKGNESFVVEESGPHVQPEFAAEPDRFDSTGELTSPDDTMSSENAVNLDQGDPLAEADFHMAYGLYDQAADLVRIALEREPDRRDLQLKLLEIYFVWGNKDAFLQTAKNLEATRDRAPAGEWDKIVIMGKQICPDDPLFASSPGGGRGAGTLVDLNLEGGENRVDIDLFGDPEGERSTLDPLAKQEDTVSTHKSAGLHASSDLDFTLDAPERGADESPTREMPPRDEPTVESELMNFADANFIDPPLEAPTTESPTLKNAQLQDHGKTPSRIDQTAEVQIDDLGLDLDQLEETGSPSVSLSPLEETDHPADAPTMLAGLDARSRQMMADAEKTAREHDMTDLERELEASFVSNLDAEQDNKTAILGPESAPTVMLSPDPDRMSDLDSTSKLRGLDADSVDMDLDRLASALHGGDTVEQPRAEEDLFSSEVFDATQRNKLVDLDVGDSMAGSDSPTNNLLAQTNRLKPDLSVTELEPVTMSEVGTKLDLARAYMDMGDPEGARSILDEVVQEGSASQKQEASRLIESLPG